MKFKGLFPLIFVGMTSLTNCTKPAFKQAEKEVAQLAEDTRLHTILTDTFSKKLTDETKIINYNKLLKIYNKPVSNYVPEPFEMLYYISLGRYFAVFDYVVINE